MRILVLNYEFPPLGGGASPGSYAMTKGLAELGHEVDVVTMHYKGLPYFEEKDGMKIYRVPCWRSKKEICHAWEQLTYVISAKRFLRQHMKTHRYDVNHTHFIIPVGIISVWLKKKFNLPYVITPHGSDVPGYNPNRFKFIHLFTKPTLRKICGESAAITSPSHYLARLINVQIGNYHIKIIPNGTNSKKFIPKTKKKIILSTGRLFERKGFQYLIKAVSHRDTGYEVHIAGDGPMMPILKNLAKTSKTKIVFHGWMNNNSEEYKNLLGSASIYCLTSSKENSSIAILEAMSAGCAVITSNVSGCPETIGDAGITITPKNVHELRAAIEKLMASPALMRHYGKKARERAANDLDWMNIVHLYESILKDCQNKTGTGKC